MGPRRAGRERSRNGCLTCKIRRVKCDETSPQCRKCTETGRKCEGPIVRQYQFICDSPAYQSTTPKPQMALSPLVSRHCEYERRAFDFFIHHMAGYFVPAVDAPFWKGLVPCLSQTYSFVWDVVVCCSLLTEYGSYKSLTATSVTGNQVKVISPEHRRALKYYDRAIVSVQQLARNEQVDDSLIVLSYMLFASVEFVQQNVKTGNDLVKRCCKTLTRNLTSPSSRQDSAASQAIHQVVAPFVLRRAIVIATLGNASPPQGVAGEGVNSGPGAMLVRFPEFDHARIEFRSLVHDCYNMIRFADFLPHVKDNDPRKMLFMSQRQSLLNGLMKWKVSFTILDCQASNTEAEWVASYLLMYWIVCYISLEACISPFETVFDDYTHHFAEVIRHATIYLKYDLRSTMVQVLPNFDHGVIPPLYFCATKCRHPILRREALRLLRQAPKSEDIWAFIAPDRVVAKVISAEEGDSSGFEYGGLPPEERRYAYVSVVGRRAPGGTQHQALEMSRFEYATDGSRRLVSDYAWVEDMDKL